MVGCRKILSFISISVSLPLLGLPCDTLNLSSISYIGDDENNDNRKISRITEGHFKDNVCKLHGTDTCPRKCLLSTD